MKIGKDLTTLALVGGIAVAGYFAYESNFLGLRDMVDNISADAGDVISDISRPVSNNKYSPYPFQYPYPPTQTPQYAGPTTQSAAHYKMAGPPNIRIQGAGLLPNPNLWVPQGGLTSNRTAIPGAGIDYGCIPVRCPTVLQCEVYNTGYKHKLSIPYRTCWTKSVSSRRV